MTLSKASVTFPFVIDAQYKRSDIHDTFGGNRQRGISVSKNNPMILIFSGNTGKNYGYQDGWQDHTTFFYTGEGQIGDQEFKEGNKALRDHEINSKDVFLFEKDIASGMYIFKGQLTCIGYHTTRGTDKLGQSRQIIVFEFETTQNIADDVNESLSSIDTNDLNELKKAARASGGSQTVITISEKKAIVRKRAAAVKKYALVRADGICEACNHPAPFVRNDGSPFLEVHHLTRLSDGGLDDPDHVAAICPNCHRRVHYSIDAKGYNNQLIKKIAHKELQLQVQS